MYHKSDVCNFSTGIDFLLFLWTALDRKISETIYTEIKTIIGEEGTIIVPTFTYGFCSGDDFDIDNTPGVAMGNFSEYVRKLDSSIRSKHPMQSISANGRLAEHLCEVDTYSTFAENGPFDRFIKASGKMLLLGVGFENMTILHIIEERFQVPYRYWKEFSGNYIQHGESTRKTYGMYVRDLDLNPEIKIQRIEDYLTSLNAVSKRSIGEGVVKTINIVTYIDVLSNELQHDPYFLIKEDA